MPLPPSPSQRDPAEGWVHLADGRRFWGRNGGAGVLAWWPGDDVVLLQLRAAWGHFGGTWGLPGGARTMGEGALEGALREAYEEARVPADALRVVGEHVVDLGVWSYTTVVAVAERRFEPEIGDAESDALRWVPVAEVADLPLHPGLADAWPELRARLHVPDQAP